MLAGKSVMLSNTVVEHVEQYSKFWHEHRTRLIHTQEEWRGREGDYLQIVKQKFLEMIEDARSLLIKYKGLDIKTGRTVTGPPHAPFTDWQVQFFLNVERDARDLIEIGKTVALCMEAAKRSGKDPEFEGYDAFFRAMHNVPAAGTVLMMLDAEGGPKEVITFLMAGWADENLSVHSEAAPRLRKALATEDGLAQAAPSSGVNPHQPSQNQLRRTLRENLPGAVLEAAQSWKPGEEPLVGEYRPPKPGKKTAGRGPRNFRSRVAGCVEKLLLPIGRQGDAADPYEDAPLVSKYSSEGKEQPQGLSEDTMRMARGVDTSLAFSKSRELSQSWNSLIQDARLKPNTNEYQIAEFLRDNLEWLMPGDLGKINLRYGAITAMAQEFGRDVGQIRVEKLRLVRKLEKVLSARQATAKK